MCETTLQNILSNAYSTTEEKSTDAIQQIERSEKNFLLQQSIHRLQEVGQLRVKIAVLIDSSGQVPAASFGPPPTAPLLVAPSAPIMPDSDHESTNGEDPFTVDLRHLTVLSPGPSMSLSEFMDCGGQLEFCVAIDFTSSNGKCAQISSIAARRMKMS